jgi:GNAT superfamily N-acetyltransferase
MIIRKAIATDIPAIHSLIRELAEYEQAPEEVIVTENDMLNYGFGSNPLFTCYVAEDQNQIIGMALYYIKYSTWKGPCVFLEDIIVTQSRRKEGIGKLLFDQVLNDCRKMNCKRMEWQVLDWNTPAIKFYEQYEPEVLKEWLNYRLSFH